MEHFHAAIVSAFCLLAAVMGDEIALMAVIRLDVTTSKLDVFPNVWENLKCLHATSCSNNSLMHTSYTAIKLWQLKEPGHVRLLMQELQLLAGGYVIGVSAASPTHVMIVYIKSQKSFPNENKRM